MGDGPLELGTVPLVEHAQLGVGLAGPGAGLALSVALQEVAQALGAQTLGLVLQTTALS